MNPLRILSCSDICQWCVLQSTQKKPIQADTEKWNKPDKMVKIFAESGPSERMSSEELAFSFTADESSGSVIRDPDVIYTDRSDQQTSDTLKNDAANKGVSPLKHVHSRICVSSNITHHSDNWKPCAGVLNIKRERKRTSSPLDQAQRREKRMRKERDRRRSIRLSCDELNLLVPFCSPDTDKVTTLLWTITFLKYICEVHGDSLKQGFASTVCDTTGLKVTEPCKDTLNTTTPALLI